MRFGAGDGGFGRRASARRLLVPAALLVLLLAGLAVGLVRRSHHGALHAAGIFGVSGARLAAATRDPALVAGGWKETRYGARGASALWRLSAFFELPAKVWGRPDVKPGTPEFRREIFRRYGLHYADYENDGLPMGLLRTDEKVDGGPGFTVTCEYCHSASLFGRLVPGQPNPWSNMEQIWIDMAAVTGARATDPLYYKNPLGNTVVNGADQFGLLGLILHNEDGSGDYPLIARWKLDLTGSEKPHFDELAYVKTPPWYTFATKQAGAAGFYWDGGQPKSGNFAAFTYLATFFSDTDARDLADALHAWEKTGAAYLATVAAPRYPFAIDRARAAAGRELYEDNCAHCHGSYAAGEPTPERLAFPGRVIPVARVGTDPKRARMSDFFVERTRVVLKEHYEITNGYVAPPLTGIWARAPYLHNGSVPTLAELLDPPSRRAGYVLAADPDRVEDYDQARVGWRVEPLPVAAQPLERVYDPARVPGLANRGHEFGARLAPADKRDLIEFLKTL